MAFAYILPELRPSITIKLIGKVRRYYIAVEEIYWDYGPSRLNKFDGGYLTSARRLDMIILIIC